MDIRTQFNLGESVTFIPSLKEVVIIGIAVNVNERGGIIEKYNIRFDNGTPIFNIDITDLVRR